MRECNYENSAIDAAVSCFHGNIGMCERYITDEKLRRQVDLTKSLADSIIRGDEYRLNVDFFSLGRERNDINSVLSMLDLLVRDAAVAQADRKCMERHRGECCTSAGACGSVCGDNRNCTLVSGELYERNRRSTF